MLKTHIPKCQNGTKYLVMFGIHGSEEGLLLNTDENLRIAFNEAIASVKRTEKDILEEKAIKIEPLEIQTQKLESGKFELVDKFTVATKKKAETATSWYYVSAIPKLTSPTRSLDQPACTQSCI